MLQVSPRSPLEDQAQPHRRIQKLSKTPDATADTMLLSNLSTEPDQAHAESRVLDQIGSLLKWIPGSER